MMGGDLTHHGDRVTFETILYVYDLTEPGLHQLGRIKHEADFADDLYDAPQAPVLDASGGGPPSPGPTPRSWP